MRVLLINPVQAPKRGPYPGIALTYISAALKRAGAEIRCLDFNATRPAPDWTTIEAALRAERCDVVGISALITAFGHVQRLAALVRRCHPTARIWVGGSIISPKPRLVMREIPEIDVGVIGEGEETAVELLESAAGGRALQTVRGIIFRDEDGELVETAPRAVPRELDVLPLPDWSIFDLTGPDGYCTRQGLALPLITHRGCPFECTYCYHDRTWRGHSVERVMAEIERGLSWGIREFQLLDDLCAAHKPWMLALCERLRALDPPIRWHALGRANIVDRELLAAMKSAGCTWIGMGFESASPRVLRHIRKHLTPKQMSNALSVCREVGLRPEISFMIGHEADDLASIADSVEFMKRELITASIFITTPYPGTPLYDSAARRGLIPDEPALFHKYGEQGERVACNVSEFADNELIWLQKTAMRDVRRHYDKTHYQRAAREHFPADAERVAIIGSGYEGENAVVALLETYPDLTLFVELPRHSKHNQRARGAREFRGAVVRPLHELIVDDFDAVLLADREESAAVVLLLDQQGARDRVVRPYDEAYWFSKTL